MPTNRNIIAITGATGFIGKYLVSALSKNSDIELRLLVRKINGNEKRALNITYVQGDLIKPESLKGFLVQGCTVINLAYSFDATSEQNVVSINNLIDICKEGRVKRLIHCSTAAVYGRTHEDNVDELSECKPKTEYGKTKLLIEELLSSAATDNFEYVNIRPTAVYGLKGQALIKLIHNLESSNVIFNYLRSCLFNVRALNLVHVSNVVMAIIFLIDSDSKIDGHTFIISEDFETNNNYKYVENYFLKKLIRRGYVIPVLPVPLMVLSLLLRFLGRDSVNPRMTYDTSKLKNLGFEYNLSLDDGLDELISWHKQHKSISGGS